MFEKDALEALRNDILQEAILQKERIIEKFNKEKEKEWEQFKQEVDAKAKSIEETARRKASQIEKKIISLAELEANKRIYMAKEDIIKEVLQKAKEETLQIKRRKNIYAIILEKLVSEVVRAIDSQQLKLRVNPEDIELVKEKILPMFRGKDIEVVGDNSISVGVIGESEHIIFDNTLEGIWVRKEEKLRTIVTEELFEK